MTAAILVPLAATWILFLSGALNAEIVTSGSMSPTLEVGDRLITKRWTDEDLVQGDIVVVRSPIDNGPPFVKRLVALPGDKVQIFDQRLYVNDTEIPTRNQLYPRRFEFPPKVMGDDEYFVVGDNFGQSDDSTSFGPVPRSFITAKVWFRYAPSDRRGAVE